MTPTCCCVSSSATSRSRPSPRARIADAIEQLLETAQLDVESSNDVAAAIQDYRRGAADFADALLVRVNAASGCTHTVTFGRKATKLAGFELLKGG